MTRNQTFDKILKFLYDNPTNYYELILVCKDNLGVTDSRMVNSIRDEMLYRKWVNPMNANTQSVALNYEGKIMYKKHGSYSSFLRFENNPIRSGKWSSRLTTAKTIITIITTLGMFILAIYKIKNDNKIKKQETEIKLLTKTINSLRIELNKPTPSDTIRK